MAMKFLLLAALTGLGSTQQQAGQPEKTTQLTQPAMAAHEKCATACSDCQRACDMCVMHCGSMLAEGKKEHLATLRTCQDCATVCAAAACVVARHGPFSDTICTSCAEACNRCGRECDKFPNDPMMKKCADVCKACEKACRDMLAAHAPRENSR